MKIGTNTAPACPAQPGPTIGLCLADNDNVPAQWRFEIYASSREGRGRIATILSNPPSAGSGRTRWIAFIHVPGAFDWQVFAFPDPANPPGYQATLDVVTCAGPAGFVGASVVPGYAVLIP